MMAGTAREGHYFKVLQRQAQFLGDYEEVHFRKSSVAPPISHTSKHRPISIAPRRPSRSQVIHFSKATASRFLSQTESLWLMPNLTRLEATELLLDRPVGSFVVRGSQRAQYALSLRIATEDIAIKHFLIQANQQKFLTIQGSNLSFVSIYDLLAYFCFHQSGGMPCCLKPPNPADHVGKEHISESSESDSDAEEGEEEVPPIPPRTASMSEANTVQRAESARNPSRPRLEPVILKKKVPPPKPPRPIEGWGEEEEKIPRIVCEEKIEKGEETQREVSGMESHSQVIGVPHSSSQAISSTSTLPRQRSKSSECVSDRRVSSPVTAEEAKSTSSTPTGKRKVSLLIEMFESKSPNSSPKRNHVATKWGATTEATIRATIEREEGVMKEPSRRHWSCTQGDVPVPPPKPQVVTPPVPPRPLSTGCGEDGVPIVPPRTPAPLLPPKPPGSLPPSIVPRSLHRRSLSDTPSPVVEKEVPPETPPEIPPKRHRYPPGYEMMPSSGLRSTGEPTTAESTASSDNKPVTKEAEPGWVELEQRKEVEIEETGLSNGDNMFIAEVDINTKGWQIVANTTNNDREGGEGSGSKGKWKAKRWAKKKLQFRPGRQKPRKRLRKYILELSHDQNQEFGQRITEFITEMRAKSHEPHQKMLLEIRNFITAMHEYLLQHHQNDLNNCGMDVCDNSSHVLECTLQERILEPLSHFVYLRIEEYYATNGHLFQVQRSIHQGKLKSTEDMGIRPHLIVPSEKAITEMTNLFSRMMKTSCAISKLEYLLEVVRLTYENVRDSRQPKKTMNDLGADDFLPIFVWVLVQCGFTRAEIEAEYMWGLAHPSLFNGEGGYYLTTLTSAINVLKELTNTPQHSSLQQQQLPTMNNLQTELKVYFEDEHTGQYSSAYYLPIVPTMTAAEICDIIVERRQIANPASYGLFMVVDGKATVLEDDHKPQEIKLRWTLQRSLEQSLGPNKTVSPSSQFFAYKLRTPSQ